MTDPFSAAISVLALAVSIATAWLTLFRKGIVKMTQPTVIYFGPDAHQQTSFAPEAPPLLSKIYLRTLLFSTSKRGRVIESMHVALSRNETHQNFNIWVYGEDKLSRGSGLFFAETGIAANHHFMTPRDVDHTYRFIAGKYRLEVFAKLLGEKEPKLLFTQILEVSREHAALLDKPGYGLYFDWGPDSSSYFAHAEYQQPPTDVESKLLGIFVQKNAERKN